MAGSNGSWAYRAGAGVAVLTAFLTLWTTVVRDDDTGIGFIMLVLAAAAGSFTAWFRPAAMARAMFGVAIMQVLLAVAIATAPSTATTPDGGFRVLLFSGVFSMLWLISAALFGAASKGERQPAPAR